MNQEVVRLARRAEEHACPCGCDNGGMDRDARMTALASAILAAAECSEGELANVGADLDDVVRWACALAELHLADAR